MQKITVNMSRCKRCGICIAFCPVSIYDKEIDGAPIPTRVDKCIGCKRCELMCPDFAIKVEVNNDEK